MMANGQIGLDSQASGQELITVVQLPVIVEQLHMVKAQIEAAVSEAISMECTEANLQVVKKKRTELRKAFDELEQRRKMAKDQVMAPYNAFESVYKECVTDVFLPGDRALKAAIDGIEDGIKQEKADKAKAYFDEYARSLGIDFLTWEQVGISVTKSVSGKRLNEQATACLDRVHEELELIKAQECADEILAEYKTNGCNVSGAVLVVKKRHEAVERERQRREAAEQARQQSAAAESEKRAILKEEQQNGADITVVEDALSAPDVMPVQEDDSATEVMAKENDDKREYELSFRVWGTLPRLKAIKDFLVKGGYRFE